MISTRTFVFAALPLALASCRELQLDHCPGADQPTSAIEYLYLPAEQPSQAVSPQMSRLVDEFGGRIVVSHHTCEGFTDLAAPVDYSGIAGVMDELAGPAPDVCAVPAAEGYDLPPTFAGPLPDVKMPKGDSTWKGYGGGGCGTWATLVCDRILGDQPANQAVDKDEWNKVADAIKQTPEGGSTPQDRAKYYTDKGYCAQNKRYDGTAAEIKEMKKRLDDDKCDVKADFYRMVDGVDAQGKPTKEKMYGHVETVTKVDATYSNIHTNSFGVDASFSGGSYSHFSHSRDGASGAFGLKEDPNLRRWPGASTEVWVEYVCKCDKFDKEAKDVLRPLEKDKK
jgi:hypothetical protein